MLIRQTVILILIWINPGLLWASEAGDLYETSYGNCVVKGTYNSYRAAEGAISVRAFETNRGDCRLTVEQLAKAITASVRTFKSKHEDVRLKSIFIGRIYVHPWLSKFMQETAAKDDRWNRSTGRPVKGHANSFVNKILYSPRLFSPVINELQKSGLKLTGVSCEKVLVNDKKLPYDAMCWLKLS